MDRGGLRIVRFEQIGERLRVLYRCRCGGEFRRDRLDPFAQQCLPCRKRSGGGGLAASDQRGSGGSFLESDESRRLQGTGAGLSGSAPVLTDDRMIGSR